MREHHSVHQSVTVPAVTCLRQTIDLHDCLQRFRQENQKLNNFLAHTYLTTYMAIAAATASTTATA